jgi:pimeloyl-ACP methyl ester carboxylesterase
VPGAGHAVNLTRPDVVNAAFMALLDRAAGRARETGS